MKTMAFFGRLFNVRPGEWPRLALLYLMALVALTGLTWLDAIVAAAFLQRVGVQYLPWVFVSSAACSLVSLFIYTGFADRVSHTKLLIVILAVGGAGLLLGLGWVTLGIVLPGYLLMYLALNVPLLDLYNVHWATYVDAFYDIRAAKRILPVLGTTSRLSGVIAGLSMPLLNRLFQPATIIIFSVALLAVMVLLALAMPRLLHERPIAPAARTRPAMAPGAVSSSGSYGASLREGYQQVVRLPLLRWMALSLLSMTVLMALLNYQSSAIFQTELKTTVAIANFMGVLSGVVNLVVLPVQLLLLSRMISRIGLGNANLIYPVIGLLMSGGLVFVPGLPSAAFAFTDRTALRTTFHDPVDNLLYNAVPLHVKARARAFVGGLLVPVGTILAGLLLLTPLARTWFLSAAILALALVFLLAALRVRRDYGRALVTLLEQEDFSSLTLQIPSLQAPAALPVADAAALAGLAEKLRASESSERAVFIARLMVEIGGEAAVPILATAARQATDHKLCASLLDLLAAADVRRGGVRELYEEMLIHGDGQVRLAAIGGLEQLDGPQDSRYLEVARRLLADPEIAVRLRVLPALLAAADLDTRTVGSRELRRLMNAPEARTRAQAVQVAGQARAAGFLPELVRSLADRSDEVRLAAALAAETLAGDELRPGNREMLLAFVIALLYDPVERARTAAVTVLGRLSQDNVPAAPVARGALAASLADASRAVREQAVEALVRVGRRALPQVQEHLNSTDPQLRKMAALVLARLEPRRYAPLISGPALNAALLAIYRNLGCLQALARCPGPAARVLGDALRERNAAQLSELFYLLGAIQDPAAVETVAHSLSSPESAIRADAAEALEALTASQTAALITPLFEPDLPPEELLSQLKKTWDLSIPDPQAALRLLLRDAGDVGLRTLAAATLGELRLPAGPLSAADLAELMDLARADPEAGVRAAAGLTEAASAVTLVERLGLLREVPFFASLTSDQLIGLAEACEEQRLEPGGLFFEEGEAGGALYLIARGKVAIEQGRRTGARIRLAVDEARCYFGESGLFDRCPRSTAAVALQDTLVLRLRREPVIELAGRQPDIYLALINVLAQRLREANEQIAGLARSRPRQIHRLFDSLEGEDA